MHRATLLGFLCGAVCGDIERVEAVIHTNRLGEAFAHEVLLGLLELLVSHDECLVRLPLQLLELVVVAPHVVVDGPGVLADRFLLRRRILLRVRRTVVDVVLLALVFDEGGVVGSICLRRRLVCGDHERRKV